MLVLVLVLALMVVVAVAGGSAGPPASSKVTGSPSMRWAR